MTTSSVEGDPIRKYFRYEKGSTARTVFVDSTDDRFGSKGWLLVTCPAPDDLVHRGDCHDREMQQR